MLDEAAVVVAADEAVARALAEDLDVPVDATPAVRRAADVTAGATVPADLPGEASLIARADGTVAGCDLVARVFAAVDPSVEVVLDVTDGQRVTRGDVLGRITGPLASVLAGERTALNFLTHLSGVATRTRAFADAVAGTGCVVRDTRKTTPGLRLLEKAAVRAGGGVNHRVGLWDALLVKDNHIAAAGGVAEATRRALAAAGDRNVQVEVTSIAELDAAVAAGARDVLLDNFTPEGCAAAVAHLAAGASADRVLLEASGTIRLDTVAAYAASGVDRVAVGGLTHSAPQLDIALDVRAVGHSSPAEA
ncbi:carboxylating nicotinate-nucleotide diphosphorylase [Nitriliruptor alkaliphilus]|uniref:carboxylating nicotinate-nucleotide diphosphorylase n=1 Tax=Nitriliruptor alkaliphilus TaxID=427918 RepID=UPI000696B8CD|nr:carboxylating nicotinate-nucleotide diphosphorylase [Nitriliruptor alkaliphilus]